MTNRYQIFCCRLLTAISAAACLFIAVAPTKADSAVPALMGLLKSGRLPKSRIGAVVELVCKQGNAEDLGYVLELSLKPDGLTGEARTDALQYLAAATVSRKVKPQGDHARLAELIRPASPERQRGLQRAAIRLCGLWKVRQAGKPLRGVALNPQSDFDTRTAAIESLMSIGGEAAFATAEKLAGAQYAKPLRYLAVAGMAELDLDKATALAIEVLKETTAQDDPAMMIAAFLDRKTGPDKLAAAVVRNKIPLAAARLALRYMYSVGRSDAALSAALANAAGINRQVKPLSAEEVKQLAGQVLATGNAERGEEIFRRADVSCMKCHAVSKAGGDVGPDLSALGASSPVDYVVKSILFPNEAVKEQYRAAVIVTVEGKVFTGIVKDRNGERIVLKEATGTERIIAIDDIEEEVQGTSLMPQGLTKFLADDELVDLVRFLSELGKPGPYAIRKTPTIQRWRVMQPVPAELRENVPDGVAFGQAVLENKKLEWKPAYGKVAGGLPLAELARRTGSSVLYLQGEVDVSAAGRVVLRINAADGIEIWIDDEAFDPASPIETNLSSGRHRVTLRIDVGQRETKELRVEVDRAEGSAVQLTVVGGR